MKIHQALSNPDKVKYFQLMRRSVLADIRPIFRPRRTYSMYAVDQFYPWFKFYFPLFETHCHTLPYPKKASSPFISVNFQQNN